MYTFKRVHVYEYEVKANSPTQAKELVRKVWAADYKRMKLGDWELIKTQLIEEEPKKEVVLEEPKKEIPVVVKKPKKVVKKVKTNGNKSKTSSSNKRK